LKKAPGRSKDLLGIPWFLASALKADDWILRQEIIWHKPSVMPSSARDRTTLAHEHIFMLTKQGRYFYNADAIKEPVKIASKKRAAYGSRNFAKSQMAGSPVEKRSPEGGRIEPGHFAHLETANARSVWTIAAQPVKGHYATFPEEIPRRAILAGSLPGDTVLDCFMGSGTTGVVARRLGRKFIGIDLNPKFVKRARRRIEEAAHKARMTPPAIQAVISNDGDAPLDGMLVLNPPAR
jgi:DNA modification methylase